MLEVGATFFCDVKGVDNGDGQWADSGGQIIFSLVGRKLLSQKKVDGDHFIKSGVWGPHGHKYLSHGADVLIQTSFVDDIVVGCRYDFADLVRKYM